MLFNNGRLIFFQVEKVCNIYSQKILKNLNFLIASKFLQILCRGLRGVICFEKWDYAYKDRTDALIGSLKDGSEILYRLQLVTQGIKERD